VIRIFFIFFLLILSTVCFSQDADVLKAELKNAKSDTLKLRILVELTDACEINEIEDYANQAIALADLLIQSKKYSKNKILVNKATAINNKAFYYHSISNYIKAIEQYGVSLQVFEEIGDTNGIIMASNNIALLEKDLGHLDITIGYLNRALRLAQLSNNVEMLHMTHTNYSAIYVRLGLIDKALEHSYKGLKIQESINNEYGKGYALNTIASLFYMQKDLKRAEEFYFKSLKVREGIKDEIGVSTVYNNLAKIYEDLNQDEKALEFHMKCLEIRTKIKFNEGIAQSYSNLGSYYLKNGDPIKTLDFYNKGIEIREKIKDYEGLNNSYVKMADFLLKQNKLNEAETYGKKALKIAQELSFTGNIESSSNVLFNIYQKLGKDKEALQMHILYVQMKDSLFNAETQKSILTKQINYEYDKKKLTDSLQFAKEQEVKDLAIAKQDAQLKQEKTQRFALYGGLILFIVFAGLMYNRFKITQKQKLVIEKQKELVEEKQKEIIDSIKYAKRIQDALMTSQGYIERNLKRLKDL